MKKAIYTLAILLSFSIMAQSFTYFKSGEPNKKSQTPTKDKKPKKTKKSKTPPPPPAEPFADFKFENTEHNFGNVPNGPDVSCEFKFTNIGNQPLIITNATAPCGCTVPEPPKDPIAPGKTGVIKVVYHTSGRVGTISKAITVNSNSKSEPIKLLYIKGTVVQ